nr:hypothetical protein TetV2_00196 [Oceanusvirus sp.]
MQCDAMPAMLPSEVCEKVVARALQGPSHPAREHAKVFRLVCKEWRDLADARWTSVGGEVHKPFYELDDSFGFHIEDSNLEMLCYLLPMMPRGARESPYYVAKAASSGNVEVVEWLLSKGFAIDHNAIHRASECLSGDLLERTLRFLRSISAPEVPEGDTDFTCYPISPRYRPSSPSDT